jgi:hypothetical protein
MGEHHRSDIPDLHADQMVGQTLAGKGAEKISARLCRLCRADFGLFPLAAKAFRLII